MTRRKALLLSVPIIAVLAFGAVKLSQSQPAAGSPQANDPRQEPILVAVAAARPAGAGERAFTGVIAARVQSNLGFRVTGKVIERLVDVGQRVTAGQPLMRIDPKDLSLALEARRNAAEAARAQLVQVEADEVRYRKLSADGWTPRQRYEQAKAALDTARAQLAAAEAQAEVAQNETGYSTLTADADGTVMDTLAEPGQVVSAGQVVVRLAHAGAREAVVNLPETARPAIGTAAQAGIYGMDGTRSPARLRQLSDSADALSRTYEARFVLDGTAAEAPLGATVTLWLPRGGGQADAAQTQIPLGALLDDGRTTGAWVIDGSSQTVSLRALRIVRLGQESATVTGLQPGETIVALGAHLLHAGDRVRSTQTQAAAK
ncbi:hemolysin secretion protein D [Azorhizobium oxalatiphilum]|uniref:Hemolysin secretion protein D n=1 Tax=Azorhizobium oxalatiphilum TaxID=980631 RepID=A0A917CEK6_9HYPH|nr:efflux RND transporter periplasmic adaptor subunit [Azorhizobium oxalatiphilum]GGF85869.1 hemolysin secretion protein D [Azorhizobium oxalatiphilum]